MTDLPATMRLTTHAVSNQPDMTAWPPLWDGDPVLRAAATQTGASKARLAEAGNALGAPETRAAAAEARRDKPRLLAFDRGGARRDEVAFSPGYHRVMGVAAAQGYAALPWTGAPGGHTAHAALVYMLSQVEPGIACPLTMTYAAVPALERRPDLAAIWRPKLTAAGYDPTLRPIAQKSAATLGMAMTEKQGGSDVRANTTRAERAGDVYHLTGHKWFCSAPMSDGFLVLAQAPEGLSCFLVPRWLEGARNRIHLMRLKDKLGNHANASAEIEFQGALAHRIGDEGAGVRTIIQMVHHTRLDTAVAPAGLMRAALVEAALWVRGRQAFGARLIDQPLMRTVLADLVLEWEGATALAFAVAAAFDGQRPEDRAFARIAVALAKYLNNKRCPWVVHEAMEALGGMGYVEETGLPMLYREAPLNGIWEGSGNVICLDILRTLAQVPEAWGALRAYWAEATQDQRFAAALSAFEARWPSLLEAAEARYFVERAATLLTAAVLIRGAPSTIADAYAATRLDTGRGMTAGAIDARDCAPILDRLGLEGVG